MRRASFRCWKWVKHARGARIAGPMCPGGSRQSPDPLSRQRCCDSSAVTTRMQGTRLVPSHARPVRGCFDRLVWKRTGCDQRAFPRAPGAGVIILYLEKWPARGESPTLHRPGRWKLGTRAEVVLGINSQPRGFFWSFAHSKKLSRSNLAPVRSLAFLLSLEYFPFNQNTSCDDSPAETQTKKKIQTRKIIWRKTRHEKKIYSSQARTSFAKKQLQNQIEAQQVNQRRRQRPTHPPLRTFVPSNVRLHTYCR